MLFCLNTRCYFVSACGCGYWFSIGISALVSILSASGGCEPGYYPWIVEVFENNDSARDLLRNHGVLPTVVTCPRCENPCKLSGGKDWRCTSSHVVPKTRKRRF